MMRAFVLPWDINTGEAFLVGVRIFLVWISKAVFWRIEEQAMLLCRYFTIVLAIFLVPVAVSTHRNVVQVYILNSASRILQC